MVEEASLSSYVLLLLALIFKLSRKCKYIYMHLSIYLSIYQKEQIHKWFWIWYLGFYHFIYLCFAQVSDFVFFRRSIMVRIIFGCYFHSEDCFHKDVSLFHYRICVHEYPMGVNGSWKLQVFSDAFYIYKIMYLCVCAYTRIHTHTHIFIHIFCGLLFFLLSLSFSQYINVHMNVHTHTHTHTYIYIYIYIYFFFFSVA